MASTTVSLTTHGLKTIYQNGIGKAFKNFMITDDGMLYQINVNPELEQVGGFRTMVTVAASCESAKAKPINKRKPTEEELRQDNLKLEWSIGKLEDCNTTYESNNPIITVNLKTWFNYLTSTIGNYNYEDRLHLPLFDTVTAKLKELNPATYVYDTVSTVDDLNVNYVFNEQKDCDNYVNMNPYLMTVTNGFKTISNNTKDRFASYMLLVADTQENGVGKGNDWVLSFAVNTWGYVVKLSEDKNTTFNMSDFISIKDLEGMSELEISSKYRAVYPACKTSQSNRTTDLFVLEDTSNVYSKGIDMLPTYSERFKNSIGDSLLSNLIAKEENYIQTHFTESLVTPGLFEQQIDLMVSNKNINGIKYSDKMIDGGNIQIKFIWDSTENDNVRDNAVIWE